MLLGTLVERRSLEPAFRLAVQHHSCKTYHTLCRGSRFLGARSYVQIYPWKSWPLSFGIEQICIVLAMEARVGPCTQDRAEHLTATTGHPFEDAMATRHPPGIAGDVAEISPSTQCAFRQKVSSGLVSVGDAQITMKTSVSRSFGTSRQLSFCRETCAHGVGSRGLVAETGHLFEEAMTTYHPLGVAGEAAETSSNTQFAFRRLWKKYEVKRRRHDLSSVFMTVHGPDTPWHPQFFRAVISSPSFDWHEEARYASWHSLVPLSLQQCLVAGMLRSHE